MLVAIQAGLMIVCFSCTGTNPPATQPSAMDTKSSVMQFGGASVLKITAPSDFKCVSGDGTLHFTGPKYEVEFWLMPGVQTIEAAIPLVKTQIADQFKDFKLERTNDLKIAGAPAYELLGSGHEADDGDPGDADVIVFKVGDRIFVAVNHDESLTPAGQQGLLSLVQTAALP